MIISFVSLAPGPSRAARKCCLGYSAGLRCSPEAGSTPGFGCMLPVFYFGIPTRIPEAGLASCWFLLPELNLSVSSVTKTSTVWFKALICFW